MPTPIDAGTEARRRRLTAMLADSSRGKTNGLEEDDARKHLVNRGKVPSITSAQLALMTSIFEDGSHRNQLNENNAWKLVASHRGAINVHQRSVATAIIESGRKGNGLGEYPALKLVLEATTLNARQADVLRHAVLNGGDRDWDFVTLVGVKRLDGPRFNNWVVQQTLTHPEMTELQAACVKALVDQTRRQVNSPALRERFRQIFDAPPRSRSEVDARIATYQSMR